MATGVLLINQVSGLVEPKFRHHSTVTRYRIKLRNLMRLRNPIDDDEDEWLQRPPIELVMYIITVSILDNNKSYEIL